MRIGVDARFAVRQPRRGIGTYSLNLLNALVWADSQSELILYIDQRDIESILPSGPNVHIRYVRPTFYPLWEQIILPFRIWRDKIDLFHALGNTAPLFLPKRTKLVLTLHDVMFLQSGAFVPKPTSYFQRAGRIYRALVVPPIARHASTIITVSEYSSRDILRCISGIAFEKVVPILESCDPQFSEVVSRLSSVFGRPYLLCLGAEDPRKNTFRIIQAYLDAVKNHGIEHDLVISGYVNWKGSTSHRLVQECNAENRVHFLPFISTDELISLYQNATALLYLSLYEGFGIPLLEAFSCGCPVIASNATSIPEVGGDAAIYVDPTDLAAIESATVEMCKNNLLQAEFRSRGFRRARDFSWEKAANKTLQVYRITIERGRT